MAATETPLSKAWTLTPHVCGAVMLVGIYGALMNWRIGAYLAVAGVFGMIAGHVVIGLIAYRRVMARPWPKVPPLSNDDW